MFRTVEIDYIPVNLSGPVTHKYPDNPDRTITFPDTFPFLHPTIFDSIVKAVGGMPMQPGQTLDQNVTVGAKKTSPDGVVEDVRETHHFIVVQN